MQHLRHNAHAAFEACLLLLLRRAPGLFVSQENVPKRQQATLPSCCDSVKVLRAAVKKVPSAVALYSHTAAQASSSWKPVDGYSLAWILSPACTHHSGSARHRWAGGMLGNCWGLCRWHAWHHVKGICRGAGMPTWVCGVHVGAGVVGGQVEERHGVL